MPKGNPTHRLSYTPDTRAWQTMRLRCLNPENAAYPRYGGRGITVCDRWKDSPETFVADMGPKPSPKHELERNDNNGNYEPGNCRWATRKEQSRNRRNNRVLEYRGEKRTLTEWCELLGFPVDTIKKRLDSNRWTVAQALETPLMRRGPQRGKKRANDNRLIAAEAGD